MFAAWAAPLLAVAKALGWCLAALLCTAAVLALDLRQRWRLRHLPGPPALPLLGNLPQIFKQGSPTFFRSCRLKYGPIFKVSFGRTWMVVVAEPELLRQAGSKLLNHSLFRGLLRGDLAKLDDYGLVAARDEFWKLVRSSWQPAFSSASLSGYLPRMVACAQQLAGRLEAVAAAEGGKGGRVDIWRELGSMTLQVVGSTAYGVDFHAMDDPQQQDPKQQLLPSDPAAAPASAAPAQYGRVLVEACRDTFRYSSMVYGTKYSRVSLLFPELRPLVSRLAHALPDRPFAKLLSARADLRDACMELIGAWRGTNSAAPTAKTANGHATANGANGANGGMKEAADGGGGPAVASGSFLELMLSARDKATGEGLSDIQIAAQVQTFILAGYETTANALAFAVYCLATNPEAEARLLAEVDSVLGPDRPPTEADLPLLPYTEAVFNEAMRLFPPAHATNRHTDKGPLQVGGYTIPEGIPCFMSIFSSHHNPDVWPRVDEFIPERFLPASPLHAAVAPRVPHAHAPFGYGSRMCIGWKFAVQEAKVALILIYQRLRFELEAGQVPLQTAVGITLSPKHGVWVRPVRRRA